MKRLALLLALVPTVAAADTSYNDSAQAINHDCAKDPNVSVNSSASSATFTGKCDKISINGSTIKATIASVAKLSVNGSANEITVDGVDKLSVNGSSNVVSYKTNVAGKGKPKVSVLGTGNKVAQAKPDVKK